MDERERRLYWQCRRGMRELDAMLIAFLKLAYETLDDEKRKEFEMLLSMDDTELLEVLMRRAEPPQGVGVEVIGVIRESAGRGIASII